MKITLLTLVALFLPLIGFAVDTDGDGMTDVAELKYGFDPNDSNSFPKSFYVDDVSGLASLDGKLGTEDDIAYYSFRSYEDESTIEKYKDFINKVLPIMYYRLGHPANTMNIQFWKRYPTNSGWMTLISSNPKILTDGSFDPRLIVHEMFHAWTGNHNTTARTINNKLGRYDPIFTGWEEVAEGVCQEIMIDFTEAYPTDSAYGPIRNTGFWVTAYKYDLQKHLEWTHGGAFDVDGLTSTDRYTISAGVAQKFMIADEQFYKKFFEKYYAEIHADSNYRVTSEKMINLYSSVLPQVNDVSTEKILSIIPSLRGTKLPNKFHSVVRQDRSFNSSLQVFCGFADSNKGELWWSSSIKSNAEKASHGIPSWFPTFHANDGYFYTDTRNEEYVLSIKKLNGEIVKEINGKVFSGSRNDGGPMNVAHDSPSASYASNFDLGLYKANVAFPRFKNFTEDYISEDVYYFGLKGTSFNSKNRKAYIGIDTNASVSEIKLKIGDEVFLPRRVGENAVEIYMDSIPWNFRGDAEIIVTSEENVSHTFKKTLSYLTSPDRPKIGIVKWLIVDVNFDGVEDMYGSASDNEEVIVDDTTTPVVDNNDTEVVVDAPKEDDTTTPVVDNNDTEVVVDTPKEDDTTTPIVDNNDTEVVVDTPKEDDTEVVVDTPKEEVVEDSLNFKVTHKDGVIRFTWNADFESHIADERFLQVWWSKLGPLQGTLIYGGHAHDSAEFELAKYNFNGTETIGIKVFDYFNNFYVRDAFKPFEVNLADVIANSTEQEVVENDTTPIVDNNDTEVVVDAPKEDDTTTPIVDNNDTEVVVDTPKEEVVEDSLNFKITHKDGVIRFTWNADFESHIADERFLHVWWSKLGPLQGTLIYGGHAHDSAEFELAKYNFNGTETIGIEVLDYFNNHYVRKGLKAFEVNLADVIANSTEQEVVENDTPPVVDNNDTEVVVDDSKRQIINDERCRETTTKLEHEIKDQKIEITDLNILIIELRKQVADLNSSNLALTTEVTGLKNQVSNLNGQATSLTTENGELKGQVTNLKEDNGNLQVTVTSLNEQLVEANRIAKTPFVHDWVYTPGHGWLYIDPKNFPIIYKNDTQSWHFYEQGSINPRYFYNFNEQKWEAWDPTE